MASQALMKRSNWATNLLFKSAATTPAGRQQLLSAILSRYNSSSSVGSAGSTSKPTAAASSSRGTSVPKRPVNSRLSSLSSTISKSASTSATSGSSGSSSSSSSSPTGASKTATTTPTPARSSASTPTRPSPTTPSPTSATSGRVDNLSKSGLSDSPHDEASAEYTNTNSNGNGNGEHIDWTRSYHGLSAEPFSKEAAEVLLQETSVDDVEIKPDGIVYLPEIKYRRILNKAFGPGGWGLVPRGESIVTPKMVTREYALVAHGRLVSIARGEQDYFSPDGIPTATEGCKSNAMMRCCKDLGVASELWDPRWIRKYKATYAREVFVEHVVNKRKMKIWIRKDDTVGYPFKEMR